MKISAKVGASTRLYMKKFHKSQRDPNPSRRVNPGLEKGYPARRVDPGWLLRSCKYFLQVYRRRVDPLRRVEAGKRVDPGWLLRSCKYFLQVYRRRVDPLRRVEANPGSCKAKGGPRKRTSDVMTV